LRNRQTASQSKAAEPNFYNYDILFVLIGVSVPGKYIGGHPININDIRAISAAFPNAIRIMFGPSAEFGIGVEGGKPPLEISTIEPYFHFILHGDAHFILPDFIEGGKMNIKKMQSIAEGAHIFEAKSQSCLAENAEKFEMLNKFAVSGAKIIRQHPNFGKNLICEIETFKGCPRYRSGGCSFCTETQKGAPVFRKINHIVQEIKILNRWGCKHFRLGNQTDFYAYMHGEYENERYPKPNPQAITT